VANGIDRQGAIAVATMLRANKVLVSLNLSFNSIGDERAIAIAGALQRNHTLKMLPLRHNNTTMPLPKQLPTSFPVCPISKNCSSPKTILGKREHLPCSTVCDRTFARGR
jgi:hypothetical protein